MDLDVTRRYNSFHSETRATSPEVAANAVRQSLSNRGTRGSHSKSTSPNQPYSPTVQQTYSPKPWASPGSPAGKESVAMNSSFGSYSTATDSYQQGSQYQDWQGLQRRLAQVEDELGRARRENARQACEREALAEDLKKAQAAAHAKGRERDELRSALKQSEKEAGQLERTLAKREKEVESLRADLRVLRADHRCLEARFDEQRAHLEEALQDAAVVPGLQADLEDKDLAEQALRRNRQRNAELEKKLGSSKDRMLVLEEQIEDQAHRIEDLDGKYHEFNEGARMLTHLLRDINLEGEVSLGRLAQVEIVSDIAQPLWQQLRKLLQAHGDLTRRAAALTSATEELDAARRREREHRAERGNLEELAEDERVRRRRAEEQLERLEAKYRLAKASLKDMEGFTGALGLALHKMPSLPEITEDMERLEARWPPKLALILAATAALVRSWKTRRGEALELRARAAEAEARADRATGKAAETCQALVEQTEASLRAMKQTCACKAVREMNRKKKKQRGCLHFHLPAAEVLWGAGGQVQPGAQRAALGR